MKKITKCNLVPKLLKSNLVTNTTRKDLASYPAKDDKFTRFLWIQKWIDVYFLEPEQQRLWWLFHTCLPCMSCKFSVVLFKYIFCQKEAAGVWVSGASPIYSLEASGLTLRIDCFRVFNWSFVFLVSEIIPPPNLSVIKYTCCVSLDFKCIYSVEKQTYPSSEKMLPSSSSGSLNLGFSNDLYSTLLCYSKNTKNWFWFVAHLWVWHHNQNCPWSYFSGSADPAGLRQL